MLFTIEEIMQSMKNRMAADTTYIRICNLNESSEDDTELFLFEGRFDEMPNEFLKVNIVSWGIFSEPKRNIAGMCFDVDIVMNYIK